MKKSSRCSCFICRRGKCEICTPNAVSDFPIIEHGLIESERDFLKLDIIDWNRLNGYWENTNAALHTIASWFIGHTHYTVLETDLRAAPHRGDFPGWRHEGTHERVGRLYWNWFHHNQDGTLHFSDSPDFYGTLGGNSFWGDIGKASPIAMALPQKQMDTGDLWISIVSDNRQVVLEPLLSIRDRFTDSWYKKGIGTNPSTVPTIEPAKAEQLRLF